jgi:hypothetical protein
MGSTRREIPGGSRGTAAITATLFEDKIDQLQGRF